MLILTKQVRVCNTGTSIKKNISPFKYIREYLKYPLKNLEGSIVQRKCVWMSPCSLMEIKKKKRNCIRQSSWWVMSACFMIGSNATRKYIIISVTNQNKFLWCSHSRVKSEVFTSFYLGLNLKQRWVEYETTFFSKIIKNRYIING